MRAYLVAGFAVALLVSSAVFAKGGGAHGSYSTGNHGHHAAVGVARDSRGRIARSEHAKSEFKQSQPCPSTGKSSGACPGYFIDHITPRKRGGADAPYNMQWQTVEQARTKDRWE